MPRLRNVVNREVRRIICLTQEFRLVAGKIPQILASSFSQHLDERKLFLRFFPKVETAWNDPIPRLVKSDQIGRWIFTTFYDNFLMGFKIFKLRLVELYLQQFSAKKSTYFSSDVGRLWCAGLAKWWSNACSSWSTSLDFARRTSPSERWRVSSDRPCSTSHIKALEDTNLVSEFSWCDCFTDLVQIWCRDLWVFWNGTYFQNHNMTCDIHYSILFV